MKYVFAIINAVLTIILAYVCVDMVYNHLIPETLGVTDTGTAETGPQKLNLSQIEQKISKKKNNIILTRNLFKVEIEASKEPLKKEETESKEPEKLEATNLKLTLWGTVTGGSDVYAVIEDKKLRQQALYQVGDPVQGAKVKKILRNEVILRYQGKDQVLEMETKAKNGSGSGKVPISQMSPVKSPPDLDSPDNFMNEAVVDNYTKMMKQIKLRPHFTQGEPDGLMAYGIRSNSVFRQIGIRNGDIIKDINGLSIVSPEDLQRLFTEVNQTDSIQITVLRRGKLKQVFSKVDDEGLLRPMGPNDAGDEDLLRSKGPNDTGDEE